MYIMYMHNNNNNNNAIRECENYKRWSIAQPWCFPLGQREDILSSSWREIHLAIIFILYFSLRSSLFSRIRICPWPLWLQTIYIYSLPVYHEFTTRSRAPIRVCAVWLRLLLLLPLARTKTKNKTKKKHEYIRNTKKTKIKIKEREREEWTEGNAQPHHQDRSGPSPISHFARFLATLQWTLQITLTLFFYYIIRVYIRQYNRARIYIIHASESALLLYIIHLIFFNSRKSEYIIYNKSIGKNFWQFSFCPRTRAGYKTTIDVSCRVYI